MFLLQSCTETHDRACTVLLYIILKLYVAIQLVYATADPYQVGCFSQKGLAN